MKQDRRSLNLPTAVYEELSYLQAETRLLMKQEGIEYVLSKTAITNVIKTLIANTSAKQLAETLK